MDVDLAALKPGDQLPPRRFGPITRTTLALYAGGSGDHNPMHIDIDVARAAGQPDVFAHGMLSMAYMGQYILGFTAQDKLRSWCARFIAITSVNATITCSARVTAMSQAHDEVALALTAYADESLETLVGRALIAI